MVSEDVRARVVSYIQHQAGKSREALTALVGDSQARMLGVVGDIDDATASKQPAAGEWSLRELLRHVVSAEESVTRLVEHLARGEQPERRGGAGSMIDDGGGPYSALVERLRAANRGLADAVTALPEPPDRALKAQHPFFGDLDCMEWVAFQRVHDEDHIQHARKILAAVGT